MGLLEEAKTARDPEGDSTPCELQLNLHGVVVGPVEHGDFAEIDPLIVQFQNPLGDEGGLLVVGGERNKGRFGDVGLEDGLQFLGKLAGIVRDGGVGQGEDLGDAPVVRLDAMHDRIGIALGELEYVREVRASPGVD